MRSFMIVTVNLPRRQRNAWNLADREVFDGRDEQLATDASWSVFSLYGQLPTALDQFAHSF